MSGNMLKFKKGANRLFRGYASRLKTSPAMPPRASLPKTYAKIFISHPRDFPVLSVSWIC